MAITVTVNRPKLVGTVPVSTDLIAKPLLENVSNFEIPFCFDGLESDPVSLTEVSFTENENTVTGLTSELANVKVGSIITTAGTTSDFAAGTYVTAKPTPTTLTVSTNALRTQTDVTASTVLTVDATAFILRITPTTTSNGVRFNISAAKFDGTKALDSNGNGYDEVTYADGVINQLGSLIVDFDAFATQFGIARTNA